MKDWILVHLTVSGRHEKYRRDILFKNLTDEKVTVFIVVNSDWTFTCLRIRNIKRRHLMFV